jgi:hypothetical protein
MIKKVQSSAPLQLFRQKLARSGDPHPVNFAPEVPVKIRFVQSQQPHFSGPHLVKAAASIPRRGASSSTTSEATRKLRDIMAAEFLAGVLTSDAPVQERSGVESPDSERTA